MNAEAKARPGEAEIVNDIKRASFSVISRIYPEWLLSILPELQPGMERLLKKTPQMRGFFLH